MVLMCTTWGFAQTHTIQKSSGKLIIKEVNKVNIVGHEGSSVDISIEGDSKALPERAEGLKMISALGLTDNTGIGLAVSSEGEVTTIQAVSPHSDQRYVISLPAGVSVLYEHSTHEGDDILIKDVRSEVEVSAQFNSVRLENVTGPMAINTIHGSIEADFSSVNQENSITLVAVHDYVDVTVPAGTRANFHLESHYGTMFTDLDLEFQQEEGMKKISSKKIDATFNGGGVDFTIKSNHDDIFLRQK